MPTVRKSYPLPHIIRDKQATTLYLFYKNPTHNEAGTRFRVSSQLPLATTKLSCITEYPALQRYVPWLSYNK